MMKLAKNNRFKVFSKLSTTLILLMFFSVSFGQTLIKGTIASADDNSPMLAATIALKGTTNGTTSDHNGEYILLVKPGTHTVQISYLGYMKEEIEVTVEEGETFNLDVSLIPNTIVGEDVIVTAQAKGQLAAINQQVQSNKIVNVVSSERIKEFPDDNAAQSISRLPGIHLSGSQVVIRGIQPKMNKILINGVEMPSTDGNNRSTSLGMISSNILSGIEVFKSVTPDMDANAIGGVVNLRLQEAPEGFNYNLTTIGDYNSQEQNSDYKVWFDVSNRFFDNKLGVSLNLNYSNSHGGSDEISASYGPLTQERNQYLFYELNVRDRTSTSNNKGGNLILDYKLNNGKIIVNSVINQGGNENIDYRDRLSASDKYRQFFINHNQYSTLLLNNSIQYDQQFGRVKLDAFLSNISFKRETEFDYDYSFQANGLGFSADSLTNDARLNMDPWEIYNYEIPGVWETMFMNGFNWTPENFNENKTTASLNIEVPFTLTDFITVKLKSGVKYVSMTREFDDTRLRYGDDIGSEPVHAPMQDFLASIGHTEWEARLPFPVLRDMDYETNDNFMNGHDYYRLPYVINSEYTKKMAADLMDYSTLAETESVYKDDYWGGEDLMAGYLMAEINLWNRLMILPGVRYEHLTNDYSANKVSTIAKNIYNIEDTLNIPVTHEHILPHLHMKLRATDWLDVRFSYNQTLSRPDYNYAVPSVFYNTVATTGETGNPYIKPALSQNLDLNATFHQSKLGLVTLGVFRKEIDDIFYSQKTLLKNIPDSNIINEFPFEEHPSLENGETDFFVNNPNKAYLRGLEAEWQSNLTFLPAPFNGLVFNANYSRVWSETKYLRHRVKKEVIEEPPFLIDIEADTVFTGGLINQADDIANASIGYDYKGFSARFSFRYQGNVLSSYSNFESDNQYDDKEYKFDLAVKQKLPFKFANVEVYFNAINITNVPYKEYSILPQRGKTNLLTRYSGRRFQLGLRVRNFR